MSDDPTDDNIRRLPGRTPPPPPKRTPAEELLRELVQRVDSMRVEHRQHYEALYDAIDALETKHDSMIHAILWLTHATRSGVEFADNTMIGRMHRRSGNQGEGDT